MDSRALTLGRSMDSKAARAYASISERIDPNLRGSELVLAGWQIFDEEYDRNSQATRPITGKVLEYLVIDAMWYHGIRPIYYQARVTQIPLVVYDILIYDPLTPVTISCKASLGERWKQADLEGTALRQVYRGAYNVLLTTHADGHQRQRQIEDRTIVGLDACVVVEPGNDAFDLLLERIAELKPQEAKPVLPVEGILLE